MGATATALSYAAAHPVPGNAGSAANWVFGVAFIGAFATVGALLAWKRPGNPIGWLMSATGLVYAAGAFTELLLLFPTGQLPSRRWRPVAWAAGTGLAGWVLGNAFAPTIFTARATEPNPIGVSGLPGDIFTIMATGGGTVLIPAAGLAAVLSLAFRYRRAQAAERAQLKWLVYAGALIVAAVLAEIPAERIVGPGDTADKLQNAITSGAVALVAVAIGIAVVKYRLYDIDRVKLVPNISGSSVPMVTRTPASNSWRMGCSSIRATRPSMTFEVGQTFSRTPARARNSMAAGEEAAAIPCCTSSSSSSSTACQTSSAVPHSPTCAFSRSPADLARRYSGTNAAIGRASSSPDRSSVWKVPSSRSGASHCSRALTEQCRERLSCGTHSISGAPRACAVSSIAQTAGADAP